MAKTDSLTAARLRELLDYDPLTGILRWRVYRCHVALAGDEAGVLKSDGYCYVTIDGVSFRRNRLAWLHVTGDYPALQIEHEDTVKHHDWISNLRLATNGQNQQNQHRAHKGTRSGLLGVTWDKRRQKWWARIKLDGKVKHLGFFDDRYEAHRAYLVAKRLYHPFATQPPTAGAALV